MSVSSSGGAETSVGYVYAIIFIFIAIRIRRIVYGTRISKVRSVAYSIWYVLFAGLLIAGSFFDGVSILYSAIDAAIFIAAVFAAHKAIDSRLVFWRGVDGSIYARGGIIIYLVYVVGLVVRLVIDFVYVPSALSFDFTSVSLSSTAIAAEIATDALLAFGSGLLTGRNIRLYQRYVAIERGKETLPDSSPHT
jgi:hypothetical protein